MAGTTLGTAYVQIVPSAQGIKGSITNLLGGEAKTAGATSGKSLGANIVSFAKKAIIAGAIGKVLKDTILQGSDLEQLRGGVEKIFDEANTSKIFEDANNAYKDLNLSANDYLSTITGVGATFASTMGDQKGYDFARAGMLAVSDYATGTGKNVDLLNEKFQMISRSTSSYQSIADQFAGLLPQTSSDFLAQAQAAGFLSDSYTSLTDVPVDEYQQALVQMLQKGTEEMGLAGNTAAEASETFSGSFNAMKAAAQNFLGSLTLGEGVSEAMSQLVTSASTFFFGNFLPMIGTLFASLPEAIGAAISTGLPLIAEQAGNLITALTNGINTKVPELAAKLPGMISTALNNISTVLPQVAAKGMELLQGLGQAIITNAPVLASAAASAISQFVSYLGDNLPAIASKGGELIGNLAKGIISHLPQILGAVVKIGTFIVSNLGKLAGTLIKAGLKLAKGIAKGLTSGIGSAIKGAMNKIKEAISKPIEEAKEKVKGILDRIKGFFPLHIGNVMSGLKLPHFSITGKFGINPPSVPHFSISWYKKAMGEPYMFSGSTLFGAGEAGDEVLYGRKALMKDIAAATGGNGNGPQITNNITINGATDPMETADVIVRQMKLELRTI